MASLIFNLFSFSILSSPFAERQKLLEFELLPDSKQNIAESKQIRNHLQTSFVDGKELIDEITNGSLGKTAEPRREMTTLDECNLCPQNSHCILSESESGGYQPHPSINGSFFKCQCRRGFIGDGFSCHNINECHEGIWPCPLTQKGGYCVDRDPDDSLIPRYQCGCRAGFKTYTSNEHGATSCTPEGEINSPTAQPSRSLLPTLPPSLTPTGLLPPVPMSVDRQEETYIDVIGNNAGEILEEKTLIELSFFQAYEGVDPNECSCRSINGVNMGGLFAQDTYQGDAIDSGSRLLFNLFNTTESTTFQFDFTLYFSFVFSCYFCPTTFFASHDASRRLIRGRSLGEDWPGVPPALFIEKFGEKLIENGVKSILGVLSVAGEATLDNKIQLSSQASSLPTVHDKHASNPSQIAPDLPPMSGIPPSPFTIHTAPPSNVNTLALKPITQSPRNPTHQPTIHPTQSPTKSTSGPIDLTLKPTSSPSESLCDGDCCDYQCGRDNGVIKYSYCRYSGRHKYQDMCVGSEISLGRNDYCGECR